VILKPSGGRHLRAIPSGVSHLVLSTNVMIKSAESWGAPRQSGIPTSAPEALDADAIFAAPAALAREPADTVAIASMNLAHSNKFPKTDAQMWQQIQ
jgi:hypothetical protein